jgi:probable rhamnosyltransferase
MLENGSIDILLSLFGTSPFLPEMLRSLQEQSLQGASLICRKDAPCDELIRPLRCMHFAKVLNGDEHLGVAGSYWELLKHSTAEYTMFADQDDVWHANKIAVTLDAMRKLEDIHGKKKPLLVHSDLQICDEKLNVLHKSFIRFQALNPSLTQLRHLMIQNNVTGCTMMINKALKQLLRPFPAEAICHDWYIALVAASLGKVFFLPEATIDYRQHVNNVFGAKGRWPQKIHHEILRKLLTQTQRQAGAFARQYADLLSRKQTDLLLVWAECETESSYIKKLKQVLKYRLRKNDLIRTAGLLWAL